MRHRDRLARYAMGRIRYMSFLMLPRLSDVLDRDELVSCGGEAVARCLPLYDPAKAPFRAYIDQRLRWAMLQEARKRRRYTSLLRGHSGTTRSNGRRYLSSRASLPALYAAARISARQRASGKPYRHEHRDLSEILLAQGLDPEECLNAARLDQRLHTVINSLNARQRQVVKRHYFDGASFASVASELGLSRSAVCRDHRAALRILCKRLSAPGWQLQRQIEPSRNYLKAAR